MDVMLRKTDKESFATCLKTHQREYPVHSILALKPKER
jgi:hypothetical protein